MRRGIRILLAIFFAIVTCCAKEVMAQTANPVMPVVGQPMPDFRLTDVVNYKSRTMTLADFKGKWLFLDFWFTRCGACILSFPKANTINSQFGDKLSWVLVGLNDKKYDSNI